MYFRQKCELPILVKRLPRHATSCLRGQLKSNSLSRMQSILKSGVNLTLGGFILYQ